MKGPSQARMALKLVVALNEAKVFSFFRGIINKKGNAFLRGMIITCTTPSIKSLRESIPEIPCNP